VNQTCCCRNSKAYYFEDFLQGVLGGSKLACTRKHCASYMCPMLRTSVVCSTNLCDLSAVIVSRSLEKCWWLGLNECETMYTVPIGVLRISTWLCVLCLVIHVHIPVICSEAEFAPFSRLDAKIAAQTFVGAREPV